MCGTASCHISLKACVLHIFEPTFYQILHIFMHVRQKHEAHFEDDCCKLVFPCVVELVASIAASDLW